jgi:hypothetical protein
MESSSPFMDVMTCKEELIGLFFVPAFGLVDESSASL